MKKTIKTLIALLLVTNAFAIDRIVQENGPAGTFSTISAAISAAIDGDRIIIYPKIGDNPYVENITIDKTLELASAQDGVRYKIQGDISLIALNNRTISIIGAQLTSGNITGASAGWRTNVNIMGCILDGGNISFTNQYYVNVVSNILQNGSIAIAHGSIIGNDLQTELRNITISNSTSIPNDTMNIIANKTTQIICTSDIFLNIYNNFIKRVFSTTTDFNSIQYAFSSTDFKMNIINNTIISPAGNTSGSFNRYIFSNAKAKISNNQFYRFITPQSIASNQSFFNLVNGYASSYNYYYNTTVKLNNTPTEILDTTGTINTSTGQTTLPALSQNGSDPSFEFYDLDLTVGDAGCYGGSYTLNNYFPITGSSRVYNIDMPFGITTTGAPLNIKADGFDR